MATAASIETDWTTCPICLDVFDNPKSLPCIHGFCLKCLEQLFKDKCPGDEVPCPLCRKEFQIPPDGMVRLQHHFFIQHLVDARNLSGKTAEEVPCEVCSEENQGKEVDIPVATVYCIDCSEKLCERCSIPHRRMKGGPHQVRPLGAELEQDVIQLRGSACENHKDKKVELYCHDCNENICVLCVAVKHRHHDSGEIPDVAENFRPRMNDDDEQVLSEITTILQHSEQIKRAVLGFQKRAVFLKNEIVQAAETVKCLVDKQVRECLDDLDTLTTNNAKQAATIQEQLQLALVARESVHAYSRELLDKGRPSDITRAASELHNRTTELLADDVTSAQYSPPHVTFKPSYLSHLTRTKLIGEITSVSKDDIELTFVREVVTRDQDQLKWLPCRLSLEADRRLLYIGENEYKDGKWTAGRVLAVSV